MSIEYVRYQIPAAQHAAFLAAYRQAAQHLAASPECRRYEIAQGVEEPDNFVVRIEWTSVEAHEGGFRKGPHFPPFLVLVRPFFGQIQEMKHYRVDASGPGAGAR